MDAMWGAFYTQFLHDGCSNCGYSSVTQAQSIPYGCPETIRYTTVDGVPAQVITGDVEGRASGHGSAIGPSYGG